MYWLHIVLVELVENALCLFLEPLIVLNELYSLEHPILEFLYFNILVRDYLPLRLNRVLHDLLLLIQRVNHVTQIVIHLGITFQLLVHVVGLLFHCVNLLLARPNISFQFLDFVIQHEFEFF